MQSKKQTEILIHILVWGLILFIPFLFFSGDSPKSSRILFKTWMPILFSVLIFYINYFILVRKFVINQNLIVFVVINLVVIVLSIFSIQALQDFFIESSGRKIRRGTESAIKYYSLLRYAFTFSLTIGVSIAFRLLKQKQEDEIQLKKRQNEQLLSELQHLKYQLQPHFFLNTLNNIYALTDISPEKAKETIHGLGKLMRYLLYTAQEERVKMHQEIEFLKKYIELMRIRLNEQVDISMIFPKDNLEVEIAPLLFIPLVENAFKHGVSATKSSKIEIRMEWGSTQDLIFLVINPNFAKDKRDKAGSGIGIENLKKRLGILYPNRYTFHQQDVDGFYQTKLILKL